MNKIFFSTVGALALALSTGASATSSMEDESGLSDLDIVAHADEHRGDVLGATWTLDVKEDKGDSSQLKVQAANENFIATYAAPKSQEGQKLLEIGQNMWFIAPGASRPVPISRRQKLLGNASYGDIAGQRWSHDYEVVDRTDTLEDKKPAWVLNLKARDSKATYDAITLYVLKSDLTATRAEMRTADGDLLKTATYEYGNTVPGRHKDRASQAFISKMTITGKDNGVTTLTYNNVDFPTLSPQTFLLSNVMQNN
jgi:hypothetical protein